MISNNSPSGLLIPPHTASFVEVGTLANPQRILYFYKEHFTADGNLAVPFASKANYLAAGFFHVATQHINTTNNTTTIVYVGNDKQRSTLDFQSRTN